VRRKPCSACSPQRRRQSTIAKILTTLRPDEGQAILPVRRAAPARQVRRSIGVVGQRSGVDKDATGRENLRLQGQLFGMGGRALESRISGLLDQFGLADAADRIVKTYSGGMQRRLDVALGLVHEPKVLFLDEPTTGLDPEVRAAMWEEITRLSSEQGLTILLTTHYLEEADALTHRLVIVDRGTIVAQGTADELKGELKGDAVHVELGSPEADGRVQLALEGPTRSARSRSTGNTLRRASDDARAPSRSSCRRLRPTASGRERRRSRARRSTTYLQYTAAASPRPRPKAAEQQQRTQRQEARR
jgi:ABC-2 type transport system ATP-binding protein